MRKKYDAETPAERKGKKALRANHESFASLPTAKIDQPLISRGESRFLAGGLPVRCPHRQAEDFSEGSALLSTVGISVAHLNWATEKKVTNLMCDRCGLIQWFGTPPQNR